MGGEDRGSASACVRRRQPGWVSAGVRPWESGREKGALRKINGVKIGGRGANPTFFECQSNLITLQILQNFGFFCTGT